MIRVGNDFCRTYFVLAGASCLLCLSDADTADIPLNRVRREIEPAQQNRSRFHFPSRPKMTNVVIDPVRASAQQAVEAARGVDPTNLAMLETMVEKLDEIDGALATKRRAFEQLRGRVPYADRVRHIEAVIATRNLELFSKNALLQEAKEAWIADSPSGLNVFRRAGITLIREHAQELVGSNWGFNWELNKLADLSGESRIELAINLVEAATFRELDAAATTWLNLASILSARAEPSVSARALERLLDSGAARLADDVGDGAWRTELDSGTDPVKAAAALVWRCLGSPDAAQRWRAAHVVRDLASLGRWTVIEQLFSLFAASDAGAFQDRSLPYFVLHARLWLLFAVARLALDFPQRIAAFAPVLERIAMDDSFPHVGMRESARLALNAYLDSSSDPAAVALKARLAAVGQSKFPRPKKDDQPIPGFQWQRPADVPEPQPEFGYEYDFNKYEFNALGRLFGLAPWQVCDRCTGWIRKWSLTAESMYDFAGRRKRGDDSDYRLGMKEDYHSFGTYLAWHAIAVVGGELLLERPIHEVRSYEDPWEDWRKKYATTRPDGLWLADGMSKYPFVALHDLMRDADKSQLPVSDKALLLSLAGIDADLAIKGPLTVAGSWNSPDKVHVSITSALVPDAQAALAARSLAACPPFHMWLPTFQDYEDDRLFNRAEYLPLEAWISYQDSYTRLDDLDPFGSKAALERYRPARHVRRRFRLRSQDVWSACWERPRNLAAFLSSAWGGYRGRGRAQHNEQANALYADTRFLAGLLGKLDRSLVLLVKLQHYREKQRYDEESATGGDFTHSWLIAVIDRSLRIEVYEANPLDLEAVSTLSDHSRYDFRERVRVISAQGG
jgi:hypothetical protein